MSACVPELMIKNNGSPYLAHRTPQTVICKQMFEYPQVGIASLEMLLRGGRTIARADLVVFNDF